MDSAERRRALGRLVAERRATRSVRSVALAAGLDVRTLGRVERGERVQSARLDALDPVLAWPRGGSRAYLAGNVAHPAGHVPSADGADEMSLLDKLAALSVETAATVEQLRRLRAGG